MGDAPYRGSPHLPPSMTLPPIDLLPRHPHPPPPEALRHFIDQGTRPWSGEPLALPSALTCVLWIVLVADSAVGIWLIAVRSGAAPCSGLPCSIATLGGHPDLLLTLCTVAVVSLGALAVTTGGLSRAGAAPLAMMIVSGAAGVVVLLGVVALLTVATLCLAALGMLVVAFLDRV
jgi:hypothetical protein